MDCRTSNVGRSKEAARQLEAMDDDQRLKDRLTKLRTSVNSHVQKSLAASRDSMGALKNPAKGALGKYKPEPPEE